MPAPDGVILSIQPDRKEPDLRIVTVTEAGAFRIRRTDVESMHLNAGDPVAQDLVLALEAEHRRTDLRVRAIRSLSRAAASRGRLATRLQAHGSDEDIALVLDQLEQDGLLDDAALAAQIVAEILRRQPAGRPMLRAALARRGISPDLADDTLDRVLGPRDQAADAEVAADRAMRGLESLPRDVAMRRLAARLGRRGFDEHTVAAVLSTRFQDG